MRMHEEAPPPRFTPQQQHLEGAAFGTGFRLLATGLMLGLVLWGVRLVQGSQLSGINQDVLLWGVAAFALLAYMWWVLLRSRTTLTPETLSQTWFWRKTTPLGHITYARFMRLRGLEWLIAPRLYVRAGPGPFVAYHAATPALWAEFQRIAEQLTERP